MEQYVKMRPNVHFVNASCDTVNEVISSDQFNAQLSDPLQGVGSENNPKIFRVNSVVYAEPLQIISNGASSNKNGAISPESNQDKIVDIGNVIIQHRRGMKYKKYHINIEDTSNLACPQPNCDRIFSALKLLKAHIRKVHCADKSRYICEVCGDTFSCLYLMERHAGVHDGRKVKCHVCGASLSRRTSLSAHLRTHSGIKPHACTICSKAFLRKSTLNNHMKFVHRNGLIECSICEEKFESRSQWTLHKATHKVDKRHGPS